MAEKIRFEKFEFDPVHGLLVHRNGSGTPVETRLPPQPANLLALLLEKQPEIVSRQEIRELLWPDVQVDFDRSLHFCIRQIRSALGESATEPRFIETIPRRGYRWMNPPIPQSQFEVDEPESPQPAIIEPGSGESKATNRRNILFASVTILLITLLVIMLIVRNTGQQNATDPKPVCRVAIMPFLPRPDATGPFANNSIASDLVELLTNQTLRRMDVVGPTTTAGFDAPNGGIRRLIDEFKIDYVINGRFVVDDGRHRLLAEIIRADDGAHVWVRYFEADSIGPAPNSIADGFLESLSNPPPIRQENH